MKLETIGMKAGYVLVSLTILCAGTMGTGLAAEPATPAKQPPGLEELHRQSSANLQTLQQITATQRPADELGLARSENFSILTEQKKGWAKEVLASAELFRKELALKWLGKELPPGEAFTFINVTLADDVDEGWVLLADGRYRTMHRISLTTSRDRALGSTLAHELTHVILSSQFPQGMPIWAHEGIASLADDRARTARRQQILSGFLARGFPEIGSVLTAQVIHPTDEAGYAISVSLTEYLLAHGGRQTFLKFVAAGSGGGWDAALDQFYGIRDVKDLQTQWQTWVGRTLTRS
jgi:hypothetical protein